jgi:hypothetical protein
MNFVRNLTDEERKAACKEMAKYMAKNSVRDWQDE